MLEEGEASPHAAPSDASREPLIEEAAPSPAPENTEGEASDPTAKSEQRDVPVAPAALERTRSSSDFPPPISANPDVPDPASLSHTPRSPASPEPARSSPSAEGHDANSLPANAALHPLFRKLAAGTRTPLTDGHGELSRSSSWPVYIERKYISFGRDTRAGCAVGGAGVVCACGWRCEWTAEVSDERPGGWVLDGGVDASVLACYAGRRPGQDLRTLAREEGGIWDGGRCLGREDSADSEDSACSERRAHLGQGDEKSFGDGLAPICAHTTP